MPIVYRSVVARKFSREGRPGYGLPDCGMKPTNNFRELLQKQVEGMIRAQVFEFVGEHVTQVRWAAF